MATGAIRRCLVLAALGFGVAGAACDGGEDAAEPTAPTTPVTTATAASPSPEASPTPAAPSPVALERGSATLALSGPVGLDAAPSLSSGGTYAPPPGAFRLTWADGRVLLGLRGRTFVGARATAEDLVLQIVVATGGDDLMFTSEAGECRVRVSRAGRAAIVGTFACERLVDASGETAVRATGTFRASG